MSSQRNVVIVDGSTIKVISAGQQGPVGPTGATGSNGLNAIGVAITNATPGSVLFAGAGTPGVLAQDNSRLFWDYTNYRLGILTNAPDSSLHVAGSGKVTGGLTVRPAATTGVGLIVDGLASQTEKLQSWRVNGSELTYITASGNVVVPTGTYSLPSLAFSAAPSTGLYYGGSGAFVATSGGVPGQVFYQTTLRLHSQCGLDWAASGDALMLQDTGINRSSAGVIKVTTGQNVGQGAIICGSPTTGTVGLTIKGVAYQIANAFEVQNNSSIVLTAIGPSGGAFIGGNAPTITSSVPGVLIGQASGAIYQTNRIPGGVYYPAYYVATDFAFIHSSFVNLLAITSTSLTSTPIATTGTVASAFTLTEAAHTALTASTERISFNVNLSATNQFATGALTTQRAAVIQAPTYAFVGASTITTAVTLDITGAPIAGTNATITNPYALRVASGKSQFVGDVRIENTTAHLYMAPTSGDSYLHFGAAKWYVYQTANSLKFFSYAVAKFILSLDYTPQGVLITTPEAIGVGLTVKGSPAQSANLTNWTDNSGSNLTYIDASGNIEFAVNGTQTIGKTTYGAVKISFLNSGVLSLCSTSNTYTQILTAYTSGSAQQDAFTIAPTNNQSSIAGMRCLVINPTITTTGSGYNDLLAIFKGGSARFSVGLEGTTSINIGTASTVGFILKGASTPSVDLFRITDSSDVKKVYVDSSYQLNCDTRIYASLGMTVTNSSLSIGSNANIYGSTAGKAPIVITSTGTNTCQIQNDSADTWSIATGTSTDNSLGTPLLTWTKAGLFTFADAANMAFSTTTGTKIGTATTQKISFWNATPVVQPAHIADPAGGATVDAEARTAIAAINAMLAATGLTAAA